MSQSLRYLYLCSITILILFFGCSKDSNYVAPVTYSHSDSTFPNTALTTNFNFKPGTYWIYKDSLSGATDSFYVSDLSTQAWQSLHSTSPGNAVYDYLVFYVLTIQSQNTDNPHVNDSVSMSFTLRFNSNYVTYQEGAEVISYQPLFSYPLGDPSYSTLNVNGIAYRNVNVLSPDSSATNSQYYICEGVGLVKMRIDHPSQGIHRVWELFRSHIIR